MKSDKVRVAAIGCGNCFSSLVQGVEFYKNAPDDQFIPGLMHPRLGRYHISDIEFSCAFDVAAEKVGKDISEAIFSGRNNTAVFSKVPHLGANVYRGNTLDGLGRYLSEKIEQHPDPVSDVSRLLKDTGTDVVVNYLPVGSEEATRWYAKAALEAGCALVNAVPVFLASSDYWQAQFKAKNLPLLGDDVKSQVGATIVHRVLTNLFKDRGVRLDRTFQLNFGGNDDFLNMLERERLESKKISKTQSVTSQLPYKLAEEDIHVGPSDYVPFLKDRKFCNIRMEGTTFGDQPLLCKVELEVHDSPNSAGVVIDAVRICKLALDCGVGGVLTGPSSYLFKSPPVQWSDAEAKIRTEVFIRQMDLASRPAAAPKG